LWEFDALNLCQDGTADYSTTNQCGTGGAIGGFYAPNLMKNTDEGFPWNTGEDYTAQYEAMGGRGDLYQGDKGVKPKSCVNMWCFDRGWYGGNCSNSSDGTVIPSDNRSDPGTVGSLDWVTSSSTKEQIDNYMRTGTRPDGTKDISGDALCWQPLKAAAIGNGNNRDRGDLYDYSHPVPIDGGTKISTRLANYMCFESAPATFTYTEGQEFLFRGDDDIWVFINNQLVVDVGGNHGPAPGYVKLDTITMPERLVPGKEYPINIFFCDRRSTGSNVRISTNMYFAQQKGLFNKNNGTGSEGKPTELCMLSGGGGGCADIAAGSGGASSGGAKELCKGEIKDQVEYFIVNRRGDLDTVLFSPPGTIGSSTCRLNGDILTCYNGVKIDLSNASASVNKDNINGIQGSWTLYARVKGDPTERVKIASFSTQVNVRVAWGPIVDDKGTTITNVCDYSKIGSTPQEALVGKGYAIPGELFPVCFAVGEHADNGNFEINDEGVGSTFTLNKSGFKNEAGLYGANSGLVVYMDSKGSAPIPFNEIDQLFTIPDNGVLVLWVTGGYEQKVATWAYTINVSGRTTDEATLYSILPKFQWIKAPGSIDSIPLCARTTIAGQGHGSKFHASGQKQGCPMKRGEENPPGTPPEELSYIWVGEDVNLNLRAYNEKNPKKTCETCNFPLRLTAKGGAKPPATPTTDVNSVLISYPSLKIVNGEASFAIQGRKETLMPQWATITVTGPESDLHTVVWDSLQFRKPPVPVPENSMIYDKNGDGIGDSLVLIYSRGFRRDSLPNMIEVKWDRYPETDTIVAFGRGKLVGGQYTNDGLTGVVGIQTNIEYWNEKPNSDHYIKLGKLPNGQLLTTTLDARDSTISSEDIENIKDTIILKGKFSKKVLTQGYGRQVTNWATFRVGNSAPSTIPLSSSIDDKIPAIVIDAKYTAAENCKATEGNPCKDKISLAFSEPVKLDSSVAGNPTNNPFAYFLLDQSSDGWRLPAEPVGVTFSRGGDVPSSTGDSTVVFTFNRIREDTKKSATPMPKDTVRFAAVNNGADFWKRKPYVFATNILLDLKNNRPNPSEIGVEIKGSKPFSHEKMPISELDPNRVPSYKDDIVNTITGKVHDGKTQFNYKDSLFNNSRPIELLPVPDGWNLDSVRIYYPGTIGIVFSPDISNQLSALEEAHGVKLSEKDITIYPRVFYHTNLGNYVADRKFSVRCDDTIFPLNDDGTSPSCKDKKSKFYIAWDMKDFKGRFVGAGAYVGLYDFRWEVNIPGKGITETLDKIDRRVEMHGVKRVKGAKK